MANRSPQTIARWIDEGLIEFVRLPGIPGRRAVRRSTMLRFVGGTNVLAQRGDKTVPVGFQTRAQTEERPQSGKDANDAENNQLALARNGQGAS